jgi:hypothetical protein
MTASSSKVKDELSAARFTSLMLVIFTVSVFLPLIVHSVVTLSF